jgi:hypothetical protein
MNNEQAAAELSEFADSLQGAEGVTDAVCDAFDAAQVALRQTDAVLRIHQFMFPERYPDSEMAKNHGDYTHHGFDPEHDDCFEWDSETIEIVAGMLEGVLADNPQFRKAA